MVERLPTIIGVAINSIGMIIANARPIPVHIYPGIYTISIEICLKMILIRENA